MEVSAVNRKKLRMIGLSTLYTVLFGVLYAVAFEHAHPHVIIMAIVIGFLVGFVSSVMEGFFFQTAGQRLRFSLLLVVRSTFYAVLLGTSIIYVSAYHTSLMEDTTVSHVLKSGEFREFLLGGQFLKIFAYALIISFVINFIRQVNRMLGHNVLVNYITGRYHQPVEEERIFMFLDLTSSTTIAEKLGHREYHKFLNDFFFDITPPIVESKGQIYQYVGDEVVVVWTKEKGLHDANCINCYFRIVAAIQLKSETYSKRYGYVPSFKAGYHYGKVITGEIGDVKKEIVFHGDTVNTAARIRSQCTKLNKGLLFSADLLNSLSPIEYLSPESVGKFKLAGKQEEIELYTMKEAA